MSNESLQAVILGSQVVLILGVGWLVKTWIPGYLDTKARNRAQREDLDDLTSIIERVKHLFQHDAAVCRAQFETEFSLMKSLWEASRILERAFVEAYPLSGFAAQSKEGFAVFVEKQIAFLDILEGSRPFISKHVFDAFMIFDTIVTDAKASISVLGLDSYSDIEIRTLRQDVAASFDTIEESVRRRIEELRIPLPSTPT